MRQINRLILAGLATGVFLFGCATTERAKVQSEKPSEKAVAAAENIIHIDGKVYRVLTMKDEEEEAILELVKNTNAWRTETRFCWKVYSAC